MQGYANCGGLVKELGCQLPNLLSLPLLAISFIFATKLLKLVSSSSTSEAASRLPRKYYAQLILLPYFV